MDAYPKTSSEDLAEQIARDLLDATRDGALTWVAGEDDVRYVELDAGRVDISSRDGDGMHPFVLRVLDGRGELLTELATRPAADAWDDTRPAAPWNSLLMRLHQAAADSDGAHLRGLTRLRREAARLAGTDADDTDASVPRTDDAGGRSAPTTDAGDGTAHDAAPGGPQDDAAGRARTHDEDWSPRADDEAVPGTDDEAVPGTDDEAMSPTDEPRPSSPFTRPFGEAKRPLAGERRFTPTGSDQAS